jgi:photosystem II stability/assembly factor-like uncharacterized protein
MLKKLVFLNILLITFIFSQEWQWLHPSPTGVNLKGIWFFNPEVGIVCGDAGVILKTTDGGQTWTKINSQTYRNLNDIYFVNENKGFIVADSALILITEDGGNSWTKRQITPYYHFLAINFPNRDTGFLCGYQGKIYRTTNGGNSFTAKTSGTTQILYDLSFPPNNGTIGYVCGYNGTILKTTNGGDSWQALNSQTTVALFTIDFPENPNVGYVAGDYGQIRKTTDGGLTWVAKASGTINPIKAIKFLNNNVGFYCANNGVLRKTTDGGDNWTPINLPVTVNLNKIFILDENNIFLCGDNGVILKSTDGGNNWQILTNFVAFNNWLAIAFPNENTGFVCGGLSPAGMRTNNGGLTWEAMDMNNSSFIVNALYFTNAANGSACGDAHDAQLYLAYTQDGGYSWTRTPAPPAPPPDTFPKYDLHFPSSSVGYACGERGTIIKTTNGGRSWSSVAAAGTGRNYGIFFVDNNTGFVCGSGGIYKTTNGASSWTRVFDAPAYDLYFINSQTGYAVGDSGKIYKTVNGGTNWTTITTPTNKKLNAIFFVNNTGYAVGDQGVVLRTTDGGNNWQLEPIPFKGNLNELWVINEDVVILCGDNGAILKRLPVGIKETQGEKIILRKKIAHNNILYDVTGKIVKKPKKGVYFIKEKRIKKIIIF